MAVAVFNTEQVKGEVLFTSTSSGTFIKAFFSQLPPGLHGFHIHRAGDLRGEGCLGACEHYHRGYPSNHGDAPGKTHTRHTGDLGNIKSNKHYKYFLRGTPIKDLFGRSIIVHEKEDDLGKTDNPDSLTTGNSGKRIGCAIIGRISCSPNKTRVKKKNENSRHTPIPLTTGCANKSTPTRSRKFNKLSRRGRKSY